MCRGVLVCALFLSGPFHRVGWFRRSVCSPPPPALFFGRLPFVCPLLSSSCLSGLTRLWPGVCVCNILIDVKLLSFFPSVLSLFKPSAGGSDRVCGITANEDAHHSLVMHRETSWFVPAEVCLNCWTSCPFHYFAIIAWEWRGAKPSTPTLRFFFTVI